MAFPAEALRARVSTLYRAVGLPETDAALVAGTLARAGVGAQL